MKKTLTGLIRKKDFIEENGIVKDEHNPKYRVINKKSLYFLKRKQEDIIYENTYYKEIPDEIFNNKYIINKIIKGLNKINNKDDLLKILNEVSKITN
jgi:hypothetical protein